MITNKAMKEYYFNGGKLTKEEMLAHLKVAIATIEATNSKEFAFQLQIKYQ
jgi:hypothetical protein